MGSSSVITRPEMEKAMDTCQPVIQVSNLGYRSLLRDIHVTWQGGKLIGLVGPNGAGKSTLLRVLSGILKPSNGEIYVNHQALHKKNTNWRARQIAYLPQHLNEQIPYTVSEFVAMGRFVYRTTLGALTKTCRERIEDGLHQLNLVPYRDTPMDRLSGGERQRTAIARCLVQESPILLLDEPIASLDMYYQMEILQQLKKLSSQNYLVIVVLHNIELAARFCSHLIMLKKGRIIHQGLTQEIFNEQTVHDLYGMPIQIYPDPYNGHLRMSIHPVEEE
jgi:ABC-type cobalamin/Fe3+-siderophores transport system ATPase subunit